VNKRERRRALIISILVHILILLFFSRFSFNSFKKAFRFKKDKKEVFMDLKKPETMVTFEKEPPQPKKEEPKPEPKPEQKPKPEKPAPEEKKEPAPEQKPAPAPEPAPAPAPPPPPPKPPEPKDQAQLRAAKPTIKKEEDKDKEEIPVRFDEEKEKLAAEKAEREQKEIEKKKQELELPKTKPIRVADIKRAPGEKPSKVPELPQISEEEIAKTALNKLLKNSKEQKAPTVDKIPEFAKKSIFAQTKLLLETYDDGNSVINRRGDPNRMPSLEEMKFISYEQKIHEHLINEWKILYTYSRSMQIKPPSGPVHFSFEIAEKGEAFNLELMQSSGSAAFDQMVLRCVQSASPFPSIPKHLGVKTYRPRGLNVMVPH